MLDLDHIVVKYGAAVALEGISLKVEKGDRVALLGANGAGKSTIVNAVSGVLPLASGSIHFEGRRIDGIPPHEIVKLGIAQIPEGRLVFPKMTVWENLELGATTVRDRRRKEELEEQVLSLFPRLKERLRQKAGTMSGGEQEMLAFGRALMSDPKLILSDEVSMGLSPLLVRDIYNTLVRINKELKVTLLIVEQDARLALSVAKHCYIIETGKIVAGGLSEDLALNDVVRKVYLGEE
ncbi:MAG: ABC transporter ATP-binding protein [Desulfobacteria bacterium]